MTCGCRLGDGHPQSVFSYSQGLADWCRDRKHVNDRYASFQKHVEECLRIQKLRDERYRCDEEIIQDELSKGHFTTNNYGKRAEGSYYSDMDVDGSGYLLEIDVNNEYCFVLDLDVVKDLKKVIDAYVERREIQEKEGEE